MTEYITLEVVLHFEDGLDGSINELIKKVKAAINRGVEVADMEVTCIKTHRSGE